MTIPLTTREETDTMQRATWGTIFGLAFGLMVLVTVSAMGQAGGNADAKKMKNPVAANAASIAAGKASYQKYCRFCHGADAKGDGPMAPKDSHPPNLIDAEWQNGGSDGEIFVAIREGVGDKQQMKPFKSKMTDTEIWSVVNYLQSIGTKPTR